MSQNARWDDAVGINFAQVGVQGLKVAVAAGDGLVLSLGEDGIVRMLHEEAGRFGQGDLDKLGLLSCGRRA